MHDGHGAHADAIDHPPTFPLGSGLSAGASRLSPTAVRNQVFTVVRLREGYDLAEVDTFLNHVETTLTMLMQENTELRARAIAAEHAPGHAGAASESAARIMEMAQDSAERVLATADQQAQAILAQARDHAIVLQQETQTLCQQDLESRVEEFNAFVTDYSHRLTHSLQAQVGQLQSLLDELTISGDAGPASAPSQSMATDHPAPLHSATGRQPASTPPIPRPASAQACTPAGGFAADDR
ncbi:DivIVA domain-containing protein [Streptosporangium subroseum]|uniref:DivIVA domain-containing protein n=1 Tax=Streptosporangium subroseum TaxID=106412 RepID=UPI0030849A79|nr:DivIVA domain-containing protein [Streptosporangium subroseum]